MTGSSSKRPGCLDKALISSTLSPDYITLSDHTGCLLKPRTENSCLSSCTHNITTQASSEAVLQVYFITYHNGEDDGQEGGLEDPEHSQAYDLDQCEEMHLPQGNVTEVREVRLVLGRHHVQFNPVPELWRVMRKGGKWKRRVKGLSGTG